MKQIIRKLIREYIEKVINESIYDFYEIHLNLTRELLSDIKQGKKIKFKVIPKMPYWKALDEFIKYRDFFRFPTKYIIQWKDLILENIAKLEILNQINGHSSNFPFDEFEDEFDYNEDRVNNKPTFSEWIEQKKAEGETKYKHNDWGSAYEYLDEVFHVDDLLPCFSNGHFVISDYGIEPLYKLGKQLAEENNPTDIIVTINKILDVVHPRSDLAELFIEGGSETLTAISS